MSVASIRLLCAADIHPVVIAFAELGWNKPAWQYEHYLVEQAAGKRVVLAAWLSLMSLTIPISSLVIYGKIPMPA